MLSVAARDLRSGRRCESRAGLRVAAASTVKVDILVALLLRAERTGSGLSPDGRARAARMIQGSDNGAATALWNEIGGAAGLTETIERLGLHETVPASSGAWGKTRTSAADRVGLLAALVSPGGPLSAADRAYALELMSGVRADQRWGVSAAARPGDAVALKNGWMPRDAEGGAWTVNSMGRITGPDRDLLIAVVSHGHPTLESGIRAVEQAAVMAAGSAAPH